MQYYDKMCTVRFIYLWWTEFSKGENGCWKVYLVWEVEGSWLPPGREAAGPAAGCAAFGHPAWYPFFPVFCLSISSKPALNRKNKTKLKVKGQKEQEAWGNAICTAGGTLKGYIYIHEWGNSNKYGQIITAPQIMHCMILWESFSRLQHCDWQKKSFWETLPIMLM